MKIEINKLIVEKAKIVYHNYAKNANRTLTPQQKQLKDFFSKNPFKDNTTVMADLVGILTGGYVPATVPPTIEPFGIYNVPYNNTIIQVMSVTAKAQVGYGFDLAMLQSSTNSNYIGISNSAERATEEQVVNFLAKLSLADKSVFNWITRALNGHLQPFIAQLGIEI